MQYGVACDCGNVLPVSEGMAGSSVNCPCGQTVPVPALSELRTLPSPNPAEPPAPKPDAEILPPTPVTLRIDGSPLAPRAVLAALTADALWVLDTWQLRRVPLHTLTDLDASRGADLVLTSRPETLRLTFAHAAERDRWHRQLQARQQPAADAPTDAPPVPEGVALVQQAPDVPHEVLGRVAFLAATPWAADRGLQLRAGIRGADAVIEVQRRKCPEVGWGARDVSGVAVRVGDPLARQRLRLRWYGEEVGTLVRHLLILLVLQAGLLFLAGVLFAGGSIVHAPTGETPGSALASVGLGLGLISAWPLLLLALLWVLRRPELLRVAALAVLAVTTGRVLTIYLAHLLAGRFAGTTLAESKLWMLADPIDWALLVAGAVLATRAWRLADEAHRILPPDLPLAGTASRPWAYGLLAVTGVYAVVLFGLAGAARYQESAHVLQAGVNPRVEQEALLAFNEGAAQANRGELESAEISMQRSLRHWEQLTAGGSAPAVYRGNRALTLYNLGWIRHRQGRLDEAERYYAQAVKLTDELGDALDGDLKQTLAGAREALAGLRGAAVTQALEQKDQNASRKYEEAQVKAAAGAAEAETLFREAIALWEEILPQVTNEEYRRNAVVLLAGAYYRLGDLLQQLGNRTRAEEILKKGIEYGEKAVAQDPGRPLIRHNLDAARRQLEALREQSLEEEIVKLCNQERFAAAAELYEERIEEEQKQLDSGKDRDAAARRLAYRLDRFAWFLAHCPDGRVRNAKAAVKHARRATELQPDVGDYWYTLAMVQYRSGAWRDSLTALDRLKARDGEFDALSWLLVAMNRHQLAQRDDARRSLRKAVEWIEERQRKAEGNGVLRFQFEMMRPLLESLRREAEKLIEGKGPADVGVG